MAVQDVIVYYMHEDEQEACYTLMEDPVWSPGMAVGRMDDAAIDELETRGILYEVVEPGERPVGAERPMEAGNSPDSIPPSPSPAPRSRRRNPGSAPRPAAGRGALPAHRSPLAGPPLDASLHPTKDNVFAIEIRGPFLMPDWRVALAALSVSVKERLPDGRYTAFLSLAQVGQVRTLDFVQHVELFAPADTESAVFPRAAAERTREATDAVPFDVLLHRPEDMVDVRTWLDDHSITVLDVGQRKVRLELSPASPLAREIEALPEVRQIAQYVEPTLANQIARRLLGVDPDPGPGPSLSQTGAGEIVAVADSGLDESHPDFLGRVVGVVPLGRAGDASDLHGHGTHVAASILGDGAASNGLHRGVAPEASLFFQSIMDADGRLSGLPVDLSELFEDAYQRGARIHNNSWSANTKSFYTFYALEVDEYVEAHPDLLVTIAAGNEGSAANTASSQDGFVDWQSIGSPATAKNALTVGASRSARTEGGLATRTFKHFDAARFSDPPIGDQTISGDPECLAAFSARGPSDPRRIKPDVVAPGTDILSARASTAPDDTFWGVLDDDVPYAYLGGTSMATPLVSGCAALVRQYYREDRQHAPSAALVKATLVNGTRRLSGADALADHDALPNYHQGFGAVHMPGTLPTPLAPWRGLEFVDTWTDGHLQLVPGGFGRARLAFEVTGGEDLRICLTWTDPAAGASLQNVLGLLLEHGGLTPPKRMGNQNRQGAIGKLDRDNNVQIIRVDAPPPGSYLLQVFAANLLEPQDWALVVTGALDGGLTQI